MLCYDPERALWLEAARYDERAWGGLERKVLIVTPADMDEMQPVFGFDPSTIRNCMDLDESVRFASYQGYDFISLLHTEECQGSIDVNELNLYLTGSMLILVVHEGPSEKVCSLLGEYRAAVGKVQVDSMWLNRVHYALWQLLLMDLSAALESLEDKMEALQDEILTEVSRDQIDKVAHYHKASYTMKKHMRAMAGVGEALLVDNNGRLLKGSVRYFQSVSGRLNRMRDMAESLYESSNYLQTTYDSRMQSRMNEAVNKLTFVTVIFAPLTLITGIYGMNFLHMPELHWLFGYPFVIGLMIGVSALIYHVFKRNEWL